MMSYAEPGRRTGRFWQILHVPLVRIILASLMLIASIGAVQSVLIEPLRAALTLSSPRSLGWLMAYLAGSVLTAMGCYCVYVRIVEQRRADELSGRGAVRALSAGGLIGGALFATTLGVLWLLGAARVTTTHSWAMLSVALAFNIAGAVFEELLLRGILFRITDEALGTWLALAISALLFIGLHLDSPDAPILMIVFAGLAGGLLPSAAYTRTRRLWLPIGIHAGWDVIQNLTFGARFAGHQVPGVLDIHLLGSPLLTGGSLGLEASIVALVAALALSFYLLVGAVRHGLIAQPFWRRMRQAVPAIA